MERSPRGARKPGPPENVGLRCKGVAVAHRTPAPDRFWPKVEKTATCWNWNGSRKHGGYGEFRADSQRKVPAHRWSFEVACGPVPVGLVLDHLCRNPGCVRPDHLEPVTPRENSLRSLSPPAMNARKTRCREGHPLSGDNLMPSTLRQGRRRCRACWRVWRVLRGVA